MACPTNGNLVHNFSHQGFVHRIFCFLYILLDFYPPIDLTTFTSSLSSFHIQLFTALELVCESLLIMDHFSRLAPELNSLIFGNFEYIDDAENLALSCKQLYSLFNPAKDRARILRSIIVRPNSLQPQSIEYTNISGNTEQLQYLYTGHPAVSFHRSEHQVCGTLRKGPCPGKDRKTRRPSRH